MGSLPAWSMAMRPASTSVATTSWPAYPRQPPVTSPTYPHPITARRKGSPPLERQPARGLPRVDDSAETRFLISAWAAKTIGVIEKGKAPSLGILQALDSGMVTSNNLAGFDPEGFTMRDTISRPDSTSRNRA